MNTITEKKPFNLRAFVSVGLFISGLALPYSGIMNHEYAFDTLSTEKHLWMSVHNVSALFFTMFAVTHVVFHWRAIINYAGRAKSVIISKEALAAGLLVISVVALFSSHAFLAGR